jgi:pilus assembly protein CpaE
MGEAVKIMPNRDEGVLRLKTNLTVWVFYSSDAFHLHMSHELSKCENLSYELISFHGLIVANLAHFSPPDLIFVETGPNWAQKIVELQNYEGPESEEGSEASLIVFGNENDNGALKIALRIGAADFVSDKAELDELIPLLKSSAEEKVANRNLGELILFMNTKGGSGASMVALNSAIAMAKVHPEQVLLLDLDLQFGVINDYLNIQPTYGLTDALGSVSEIDDVSLGSFVTKHESGVHVLAFKRDNTHENYDKAARLDKLIPLLREFYSYVVVDFSRGMDRHLVSVISPATQVWLVTQQNLVAIKNCNQIVKTLAFEFGIHQEQVGVIVNRYERSQSIKLKDVEGAVGGLKVHTVPNDFKVALESANLGKPFVVTRKGNAMSKSITRLVESFLPEKEKQQGWLKRLFS